MYQKANEILSALPPELKDRSPVLNLAHAYKLASQIPEDDETYRQKSMLLTPIHGRLNESLSNSCVPRISSPSFQIPHQKSELFSVTDHQTANSSTHISLFEQLVSSDTCEGNSLTHRAVETLHDIYPQQDKGTIESVLQSFDFDVSEAVQWFTDVRAPNLDTPE